MAKDPNKEVYKTFKKLVNMTATQLEKWLVTDETKNTGLIVALVSGRP